MFSGLKRELDIAGKTISREADYLSGKVNQTVDQHRCAPVLDLFQSGNVVQLISRSSGRAMQIVQSPTGQLVVDGLGQEGPTVYNAHWTILNEGNNVVRLHNNNNFLCVINGATQVVNFPNPAMAGVEVKLQLGLKDNSFVTMESFKEKGRHVGVLNTGALKPALACGKEMDGQFGVRLVYTPYAMAAAAPPVQQVVIVHKK